MIKSELTTLLAESLTEFDEQDTTLCVNHLLDYMRHALGTGQRIEIRGFGSFNLHYQPPRNAHNPRTRTKLVTEAKYRTHFKPGKSLREQIDQSRHVVSINEDIEDEECDTN